MLRKNPEITLASASLTLLLLILVGVVDEEWALTALFVWVGILILVVPGYGIFWAATGFLIYQRAPRRQSFMERAVVWDAVRFVVPTLGLLAIGALLQMFLEGAVATYQMEGDLDTRAIGLIAVLVTLLPVVYLLWRSIQRVVQRRSDKSDAEYGQRIKRERERLLSVRDKWYRYDQLASQEESAELRALCISGRLPSRTTRNWLTLCGVFVLPLALAMALSTVGPWLDTLPQPLPTLSLIIICAFLVPLPALAYRAYVEWNQAVNRRHAIRLHWRQRDHDKARADEVLRQSQPTIATLATQVEQLAKQLDSSETRIAQLIQAQAMGGAEPLPGDGIDKTPGPRGEILRSAVRFWRSCLTLRSHPFRSASHCSDHPKKQGHRH